MENKNIPGIVFESIQARNERTVKRLILALIIITVMLFASNLAWLYVWQQYDYVESEENLKVHISTDGGGDANYIGNNGDIVNGENNSVQETDNEITNP